MIELLLIEYLLTSFDNKSVGNPKYDRAPAVGCDDTTGDTPDHTMVPIHERSRR